MEVRALTKDPSSLGERRDLWRVLDRMSVHQRATALANCCKHAVSFGAVRKTDSDYSTGAIYNDLLLLTVLYGVSWERVNLAVEAAMKSRKDSGHEAVCLRLAHY